LPSYQRLVRELVSLSGVKESDPYRRRVERELKRVGGDYLLSELASRAFLPGYGFPTGIATFDHYSIHDFQKRQASSGSRNERIDNRARLRERPGRDMPIAIREYAPGADVVLDGLVYRSAGIQMNRFIPDSGFIEPQKLVVEWRCHFCGQIENQSEMEFDQTCTNCGTNLLEENILKYIEPTGFSVEFYSSPTTDVSTQKYIPVEDPWVAANGALISLPNTVGGSFRSSGQGHIFYHSSGECGSGYAICLRCGRAGSMAADGSYPEKLRPGVPHRKLQGKPGGDDDSAYCEGPDEQYAIQDTVHLGYSDKTDVFELYLKRPRENLYLRHDRNNSESFQLVWTLAVVLRQSLGDILGINANELGYTVKPATLEDCPYAVAAIVLFDKCGGGAGFSSAAPRHLIRLLRQAEHYLDCSASCESACQQCLLGFDTRFHMDLLDRHIALDYLREELIPFLDLPEEAKIMGESTEYISSSIDAELMLMAKKKAKLRIVLDGETNAWNIGSTRIRDMMPRWNELYDETTLLLTNDLFKELSLEAKEDLWVITRLGANICLVAGDSINADERGCLLAQVCEENKTMTFATTAGNANVPAQDWWVTDGYLLLGSCAIPPFGVARDIKEDELKPEKGTGDIEIEITKGCNGSADEFGIKLWLLIRKEHPSLDNYISSGLEIEKIVYTDAFIQSPWSLLLLGEVVSGLKSALDTSWTNPGVTLTTTEKRTDNRVIRGRRGIFDDWQEDRIREKVIESYFQYMGETCEVKLVSSRNIPHGRSMRIYWENGITTTVRFDQGVGYWFADTKPRILFDQDEAVNKQVELLAGASQRAIIKNGKSSPTQIFVKDRSRN